MEKEVISVEVVSDVACPWCYIGKKRLESALAAWEGTPVEVSWHPFELNPNIPHEGYNLNTYLSDKFGSDEQTTAMTNRLTAVGKEVGVAFNFRPDQLAMNTLPLHQLLHVAGEEGFKADLKERLLKAYFTDNTHLNDSASLIAIMSEFGWDAEKTKEVLADDSIAYAVKQEIGHYQNLGVSGVPFFIINGKYGISGAQPESVFLDAFAKVAPSETTNSGDSCGVDDANC